jgi:hypothetical protein
MAKHRTVEQVRALLKGMAADRAKGLTVGQACRKQGVSEQTDYRWRGRVTNEAGDATRQLRELASEVERLKQGLAEVMLDNRMLRDVAK